MIQRIVLALCLVLSVAAYVRSHPQAESGMSPYTPKKVEWLALTLEATYSNSYTPALGYTLHFMPTFPNTITVVIQYPGQTAAANIDRAIEDAKDVVKLEANSRGWSSWLKIDVKRVPIGKRG